MLIIFLITSALIIAWALEYAHHQKNREAIPIRIHVNGTRGKSSVTRLIAAGLRAGGIQTLAKVTGTLPRIIDEKGLEIPVPRPSGTNILEQIRIVRFMRRRNPKAIVIECMAVQPEYQWICEHKMIRATIAVITNSRLDHIQEMGPTIEDITRSLCNTLPKNGEAFTSERRQFDLISKEAEKTNTKLIQANPNVVSSEDLAHFSYVEHRDNVALALAVCEHIGVEREKALQGMFTCHPDPGAMKIFKLNFDGKAVHFISAAAANDPDSTLEIYNNLNHMYQQRQKLMVLLNTRADRFDRSIQLLEMLKGYVEFDHLVLIGEKTEQVFNHALKLRLPSGKIVPLGMKHESYIYDQVLKIASDNGLTLIFAIGNMGMGGLQVANYFKKQAIRMGNGESSSDRN